MNIEKKSIIGQPKLADDIYLIFNISNPFAVFTYTWFSPYWQNYLCFHKVGKFLLKKKYSYAKYANKVWFDLLVIHHSNWDVRLDAYNIIIYFLKFRVRHYDAFLYVNSNLDITNKSVRPFLFTIRLITCYSNFWWFHKI